MALTVNPALPATAAQAPGGAASGVVLQPGTVVNAQVLKVAENLVQIAIAGLAIDVISAVPLTVGQNLQLAVSQADGGTVRLALVGQGTAAAAAPDAPNVALEAPAPVAPSSVASPPNDPLTPLERIAVSVASESAATQQASLAPLFANLNAVAASSGLPPALREAVVGVLTQQTSLGANLTGGDIQAAFQKSGLLLEASLAAETVSPNSGIPDLKAALIVLRQTLARAVDASADPAASAPVVSVASASSAKLVPATQTETPPALVPSQSPEADVHDILTPQARLPLPGGAGVGDADELLLTEALLTTGPRSVTPGAALNMLQEALQEFRRAPVATTTATVSLPDGRSEEVTVRTNTPLPPFRGALPSAQPVAGPTMSPRHSRQRCAICSTRPMLRSRARRCCRWHPCPIVRIRRVVALMLRCRGGISKSRSQHRRERRWRAAATRPTLQSGSGGRVSRSMSSRPVRCCADFLHR